MARAALRNRAADDATAVRPAQIPAPVELEVAGLGKAFAADSVFRDVSFSVRRGEAVALIGANGAGKSTLLRCCVRLVEPTAGSIHLFDTAVTSATPRQLRRLRARIGFVFQKHNLVPRLSALSNVIHGALADRWGPAYWTHGLAPPAVRDRAMACLDQVGLAGIAGRRADRLSGGQSQRVAIARALMQRPRLIIADEPVASLDPVAGEEVMRLFVSLIRERGLTLVFTSHHLDHALTYADRVIGLRAGRLAVDAPAADLSAAALRHIYD